MVPTELRRIAALLMAFADEREAASAPTAAEVFAAPPPPPAAAVEPAPWFPPAPPGAVQAPLPPATAAEAPARLLGHANAVPPPPAAAPTLDITGIPWDQRIHASTKTFTKDGKWRYKKGVSEAEIAQIEAQWKAVAAIPTPGPVAATLPLPLPVATAAPIPPAIPIPTSLPATATTATISPSSVPAAPTVEPGDVTPPTNFTGVVTRIATLKARGKLTQEQVDAALSMVSVPSLSVLAAREDLIPSVWAVLQPMVLA